MTLLERILERNKTPPASTPAPPIEPAEFKARRAASAPASPSEPVEPMDDNLARTLRPMYERNHASMEYFPQFVRQMRKVNAYLTQNPADLEKRMYLAHLLTEVGAGPLAVEQAEKVFTGYHLAGDVDAEKDSLLLYSIRRTFKRCGREDLIDKYSLLNERHITNHEKPVYGCYGDGDGPLIGATMGDIEFLRAQLGEQKW